MSALWNIHSWSVAALSVVAAATILGASALGITALEELAEVAEQAGEQQLARLDERRALQALLFQKGFISTYMLTGDPNVLESMVASHQVFSDWLSRVQSEPRPTEVQTLISRLASAYAAYNDERQEALSLFHAGSIPEAHARLLSANTTRMNELLEICDTFSALARLDAERMLHLSQASTTRLTRLVLAASGVAALVALLAGFLIARRLIQPIYELQLQVLSATQRHQIVVQGGHDFRGIGARVVRLIQELETADAALADQRRRLAQAEKLSEMGELTAKLAHEILNPLTGVKTAIQVLARDRQPVSQEELRETAEVLGTEVARVDTLVRRMMDYAAPLRLRREVCQVGELLAEAQRATCAEFESRRVSLELCVPPQLPEVTGDSVLLTQVFINLLTNAAQAMPKPGTVQVEVSVAEDWEPRAVRVTVKDEGLGIDPAHLQQIFHPFFTTKPNGHGLGLAVSYNIVSEHEGRLEARNRRDGRGAIFEVSLPVGQRA